MKIKAFLFPLCAATILFSCNNQKPVKEESNETDTTMAVNDVHSFAVPKEAVVTHLNWDATVNFEQKKISATATWDIKTRDDAKEITFDTYGLHIKGVKVDGKDAEYHLGDFKEFLGKPLTVQISPDAHQVSIAYETGDSARALQWLDPAQTSGKEMPFLFTQSQAILARSWIPTQDSPGIRFTYDAKVKVPEGMLALMSAENPKEKNENGEYTFKMPQPIPSYLLALAVGDVRI